MKKLFKKWMAVAKRNPLKSLTAVLAVVAGIPGGVAGAAFLNNAVDPYWYATKSWVKVQIADSQNEVKPLLQQLLSNQRDFQVEQAEGKRDTNVQEQKKWKLELEKTKDPDTRALIEKSIRDLDASIGKQNSQIETLNKLRGR